MFKRFSHAIVLVLVLSLAGAAWADLVGHWKLDEDGGPVASDSSGKGNHGTWQGGPTVVDGRFGKALAFANSRVAIPASDSLSANLFQQPFTLTTWINPRRTGNTWQQIFRANIAGAASNDTLFLNNDGRLSWRGRVAAAWAAGMCETAAGVVPANDWTHVVVVGDGTNFRIYVGGVVSQQSAFQRTDGQNLNYYIGGDPGSTGESYTGMVDDLRVYTRVLTEGEIQKVIQGLADAPIASDPHPADKADDVPSDVLLSWTAGPFAATHDVYLGTAFADVNTATRTNPKDILVSRGQTATTYDPAGPLAYGQTYYWRVDEVNAPPASTIFPGQVWSFTVEPYGYPVKPVKATASTFQSGMGPEKTIDGSGMTGDLHGTEPTSMWLSAGGQPNWIQYEFDKVYKLHQLIVWNSNQLVESFLGFGAKTVTIETSTDGATWTVVAGVPEFARAPGLAAYAANTTVNLGGAEAQFVKLTITANWGGMAPQTGLAEVRFSYVPVQAFGPQPANAATGVKIDTVLDWRPGREATSHKVFFGADEAAVAAGTAPAKTVTAHSYTPDPMALGTTYYWKVDEVGATGTYPGTVWSFTTQEFQVVDDFESYTDKAGKEVFSAWVDGFDNPATNGAVVGLDMAINGTFGDTITFYGGKQSMPFAYDNTKAPLSEATRTFTPAQDWTGSGIKTLVLYFYGDAANTATELYLKINGTKITYPGKASDVARKRWNQWNVDLTGLPAATLRSVRTLTIGVTGGAGKLLIDEIRLYRVAPEIPTAVNPGTTGLVAYYAMTNNVQDGSGSGNHGTVVGAPTYAAGLAGFGTALRLNGTSDCVNLGNKPVFNFTGSFSLSVWANIGAWTSNWNHVMVGNRGESNVGWQLRRRDSNRIVFTTRGVGQDDEPRSSMDAPLNEWVHIAAVYDNTGNTKRIYINGIQDALVNTTAGRVAATTHNTYLGARANSGNTGPEGFFTGMLDDIRIFNRALSAGEVEFLSNPSP